MVMQKSSEKSKQKTRWVVVLLLMLLWPGGAVLAQQDEHYTWDLEQCLAYARASNIELNRLRLTKSSGAQDLSLSKAAVLPDVNASATGSVTNYTNINTGTTTAVSAGVYGVNSSMTLYRGGYVQNDIRQKDVALEQAGLNVAAGENSITLQIAQAYINILLDKESVVYYRDLVQTSKVQLSQGQQRYDAGSIALKSLVQLKAQLATDQYSLTTAINTERLDILALKQLLQLPSGTAFDVVKPASIDTAIAIPDLGQVQDEALKMRPEIKAGIAGVKIAELDIKKAMAGYKPTLSLSGGVGTNHTSQQSYAPYRQAGDNLYQDVSLSLSVPIFSKRVNKTNVAKSRINLEVSKLDLQNVQLNLSQDVERAYINVRNAQSQFVAASENMKYNEEAYRIAGEAIRIGSANMVDYILQHNAYVQAMQSYLKAKYSLTLYQKMYAFYKGEPIKL